jgi:hypothetical protein
MGFRGLEVSGFRSCLREQEFEGAGDEARVVFGADKSVCFAGACSGE